MNITNVRVKRIVDKGRLKASVVITIDNAFVVRNIRIIEGNNGLFVAMPSNKSKDGEYRDIAHPINKETRAIIEEKIIKEYEATPEFE